MGRDPECPYVSRGGLKLAAALEAFELDVSGLLCADFGCSTGGFTDCLLQHGAARVIAVDTGYGVLDYGLRVEVRVEVRERTNALHAAAPTGGVDLVVADAGWTPQRLLVPASLKWLKEGGRMVTLIKPHYEVKGTEDEAALEKGVLPEDVAERVARRVADGMGEFGARAIGLAASPILGSKGKRRGNREWLALVERLSG